MDSEDPITPDASTIFRSRDTPAPQSDGSASTQKPSVDADPKKIENAKTVIRAPKPVPQTPPRSPGRTPAAVTKILLGRNLDHFRLEEMIGGGGMGAVFRAHDDQLDRTVAIKVIPFVSDDVDLQRRFKNEAQSAAKLDHPRIASVYGVGHHGDWHYIVFEYIRGTNLRDLVSSAGVMHVDDAVFYTCELASAIQHAASRGIVHRDIKPSNVLVTDDNNIKLVDMGLARSESLDVTDDMTASGVTLGTFDYISPEQAADPRNADVRSDIYSLGCTLYFMLTGSPPYPGGTMIQKLMSHSSSPPPDARSLRPSISHGLSQVIQKMLSKDPQDRYQTGKELVVDLRGLAFDEGLRRAQGVSAGAAPSVNPVMPLLLRYAPWLAAGAVLLVAGGWLKLTAPSRFDLTPSDFASQPEPVMANQPVLPESQDEPGETSAAVSKTPEAGLTKESASSPPTFSDVRIPDELEGSKLEPDTVSVSPSIKPPTFADSPPLDVEPNDLIRPREIQVLGVDESSDLLPDPRQRFRDGILQSRTLAEAVDEAQLFGVGKIEIKAPMIETGPITIKSDGLLIRSSVPGGSVIRFSDTSRTRQSSQEMLAVGSNRIEIDDCHLVWNVPQTGFSGGALVGLSANKLVRLTDCSVTIVNPNKGDDVYAFNVKTENQSTEALPFEQLPLVALELNNVVIRGEISMIKMDYATQLQLQWENGLLAVIGHLLETRGAQVQPELTVAPIQLALTRVTADAPLGLVSMRLESRGTYPLRIDREARSCVFLSNRDATHVEIAGTSGDNTIEQLVSLRGEGNVYYITEESDVILKIINQNAAIETVSVQDICRLTPDWFMEKSTRWRADWEQEHENRGARNGLTADQYSQYGTVISGFDAESLPSIPANEATKSGSTITEN